MKVSPRRQKLAKQIFAKKTKYWGLVLNVKHRIRRPGGVTICGYSNSVVLMNLRNKFYGSAIFGPSMREVRYRRKSFGYKRILARIGYFI